MKPYKNKNGNSGVVAYEAGKDYIKIRFQDGVLYLYTYNSAGKANIERMKSLAALGKGLSTFISQYVKDKYQMKY